MVDSLRVQPMMQFGKNSFQNLFEEYFVFNKLKIFISAKTQKENNELNSEFTIKNRKCKSHVAFQFPWRRYHFQLSGKNTDEFKLFADIGQIKIGPYKPSFFFNFKIDSEFNINSLRVGSFIAGEVFSDHCRIVKEAKEYSFQRRFQFQQKQWDLVLLQSISNTPNRPMKNDFQLRYFKNNTELFLHHYTGSVPGEQYTCNNFSHLLLFQVKLGKYINYRLEKLSASVVQRISDLTKLGCEFNLLKPSKLSEFIILIRKNSNCWRNLFRNSQNENEGQIEY